MSFSPLFFRILINYTVLSGASPSPVFDKKNTTTAFPLKCFCSASFKSRTSAVNPCSCASYAKLSAILAAVPVWEPKATMRWPRNGFYSGVTTALVLV